MTTYTQETLEATPERVTKLLTGIGALPTVRTLMGEAAMTDADIDEGRVLLLACLAAPRPKSRLCGCSPNTPHAWRAGSSKTVTVPAGIESWPLGTTLPRLLRTVPSGPRQISGRGRSAAVRGAHMVTNVSPAWGNDC